MPRAMWSGSISFGLVNIPVRLTPATIERRLDFDLLTKKGQHIGFQKYNKSTGEKVENKDIVKGYEVEKGEYVTLTNEEIKAADVKKTNTIQIEDFVEESEIPTEYYEKPYYIEPEKNAQKAYVLLRKALAETKKVAIARIVIRTQEHLAVLKDHDEVIILNEIRYQDEIKDTSKLNIPKDIEVSATELSMAKRLVDELSTHFNPEKYKDKYREELLETIEKKAKGQKIQVSEEAPKATQVSDLMEQLRKSLKNAPTAAD